MADLEVDSDDLIRTGRALRFLAGELKAADHIVQDHRADIGHRGFAEQLDKMQGNWDDKRNALVDDIISLGDFARKAGKAFEDIEQHLVAALEGREE